MISSSAAPQLKQLDAKRDRDERAEFQERMRVNVVAAVILVALLSLGIWLADEMVSTLKVQGCYASGYHGCSLI